ncbi:PstS family phosphate ABC transporter substrate-binding protein [Methylotenera sp. G11]|uniref:PstS family phosphate ABC transporter substrate-binding protein n=1 Tax=Methylotenera sp. G11 TaxID=1506585 RepID=UPI000645C359|nr:PstS family phosphate ABC transporter substrate-binding protein [Methylotenera sp. G11]
MSKKQIKHVLIAALIAFSTSTAHAAEKIINIDGSSTVYPITKEVADEFQKIRKTKVNINISGTGGGFAKFCRGETQIQNASRPILKKEMEQCKEAGVQYIELPIAYDALTVVVNKNNDFVKSLTVEELRKIWRPAAQGKIKTWRQVNPAWPNVALALYGPGTDSGTFDYFTEAIVGKAKQSRNDYTASEDDNVLVQGVAGEQGALGYFGYAYYEENQQKLAAVPIIAKKDAPAVLPSVQSVKDGSYQPLSRPLFIYVNATAAAFKPEVRDFVDFYLYLKSSPKLAKQIKYISLPQNEYLAVNNHWKALKPGTGFDGVPEVGVKVEDLLSRIK